MVQSNSTSPTQMGMLRSSEAFGWDGIAVEQQSQPAGEYAFPPSPSHMICLHRGLPISTEGVHNGQPFTTVMGGRSLQIVPAGTENVWRHQDTANLLHIFLTPEWLQQVATAYDQASVELISHFGIQDSRIEHICSALLVEVLEGGPTGRLYMESLSTALAVHLLHTYTSSPHPLPEPTRGLPTSLFRKITSLIEDRLSEDLSLTDLALEVGLSPSHFASVFRQTTGLSPHRYIVQRRVERAQSLLTSTKLPIGEIAAMVGFYDQSHLGRHMRRLMGVTPSSIRDRLP